MKRLKTKRKSWRQVAAAAVATSLVVGATSLETQVDAAEDAFGNNLSVPVVMVPSAVAEDAPTLRGGNCGLNQDPVGSKSSTYPEYWLQKTEAVWQAQCSTAQSADVFVNWGDNLISRPVISSRQPVRVEVALDHLTGSVMKGYTVENLTPDVEDRYATYGTRGVAESFSTVRVFDSGAQLTIERIDGPGGVIFSGPMVAEINSVGSVVYGFNWGMKGKSQRALPGKYLLTFTTSHTRVIGVDSGDVAKATFTPQSSSLIVELSSSTGRKGGSGSGSGGSGGSGSGGSGSGGNGGMGRSK